jgi:hypothetical protein
MVDALDEYMECLLAGQADLECQKQTLANLFLAAYSFINQPANWAAIAALASLILEVDTVNSKGVIDCEDVAALLADCSEASISLTG